MEKEKLTNTIIGYSKFSDDNRRTGKTTRLINLAIESLFKNGGIIIPLNISDITGKKFDYEIFIDEEGGKHQQLNFRMWFFKRLKSEHPNLFHSKKEKLEIKNNIEYKIIKFK